MAAESDELLFAEEEEEDLTGGRQERWKVLIVDDEQSVHDVTRFALHDLTFAGKGLEFLYAYSGEEARRVIRDNPNIALILLDVVMETDDAGLKVTRYIREDLDNALVRIVLRTGQPGQAPEQRVILEYDINDYKEKTELTAKKLFTTVISSLRTYRDMNIIERNRQGLERIIDASPDIFRMQSMQRFVSGVMMQVVALLGLDESSFFSRSSGASGFLCQGGRGTNVIVAGTGAYQDALHRPAQDVVPAHIQTRMEEACNARRSVYFDDECVLYVQNPRGEGNLLYISGCGQLDDVDRRLIDVFCANVSVAFENIQLNQEIEDTQKEIVNTLGTVAEFRSNEVGNHILRVAEYSRLLAVRLGLDEEEAELIRLASPMHDIGKIGIPDQILHKPARLTDEEMEVMKSHTTIGYQMLKSSERPILKAAALIAQQHQEKWDGSGYPNGLRGEAIHLYGRITALADVFDALGSKRVYKDAWPLPKILDFFQSERGRHFDPRLVDIFVDNIDDFLAIRDHYTDA
jgi:response regulator RpfG family c-di-GMP phosphodiesterase